MSMFNDDSYSNNYKIFEVLTKSDIKLAKALGIAKREDSKAGKVLANHIYRDTMCPKIGNMFAYKDFLARHFNSGIHISLDGNGISSINKEYGFEAGNEAIKTLFNIISGISRKYGLKAFRVGGDEGRLHAPTPERANGFLKELKQKLESSPALSGTNHKISVAIGMGYSPDHAEQSLIKAKDKLGPLVSGKRVKEFKPGEEPVVIYSALEESPPPGWRPSTNIHHEEEPVIPSALKLNNPLK